MAFCLPPALADKFLTSVKSGELNPIKLSQLSSTERHALLGKVLGENNAQPVNALFESKLLLKNQQRGMINWIKQVGGLKEPAKRDLIAKIQKLDKALQPNDTFLEDLVQQKLGVHLTPEQGQKVVGLTQKLDQMWNDAKAKLGDKPPTDQNIKSILQNETNVPYYRTKQELFKYMREQQGVPPQNRWGLAKTALAEGVGVARAIRTAFDLSASMRQGAAYLGRKEWFSAFNNMFSYAKSPLALDELETKMLASKWSDVAIKYKRELGLTLLGEKMTQREETFMASITDKIPVLRGSERAYTGFLTDLRFNRFTNLVDKYDQLGRTLGDKELKDLAEVIAAGTGRGKLGSLEGSAKALSTALFSPRFLASRIETIFMPLTKSGVARTEALKNLGTLAGTAVGLLGALKAAGLAVETDPRSADFGKVKVGNVTFDLTAGEAPIIKTIAQIALNSTKSTSTGKITPLNTGQYGSKTSLDVLTSFLTNRTSPVASIIRDIINRTTFNGQPMKWDLKTVGYVAQNLLEPMLAQNVIDAYNNSSGDARPWVTGAAALSELFGVNVNAYAYQPTSKEWTTLKDKYGQATYDKAVKSINETLAPAIKNIQSKPGFQKLSVSEQNKVIDEITKQETDKVLKGYDLTTPKAPKQPSGKDLLNQIQ